MKPRAYVFLACVAALVIFLFWKISFIDVPLIFISPSTEINLDASALQKLANGEKTLIILKNWQRALRSTGIAAGDLIIADNLTELNLFLNDKPDSLALIPWYYAEPQWRTLRLNGWYFWDNPENYPLRTKRFGFVPRYKAKSISSVAVGGNVLLARGVSNVIDRTDNVNYPWQGIASILRAADLSLIQLQSPLVYNYIKPRNNSQIYGQARYAEGLNYAGINAAVLNGAHLSDAGVAGIADTLDILRRMQISTLGLSDNSDAVYEPQFFRAGKLQIAVIAVNTAASEKYSETDLRGNQITYYPAVRQKERLTETLTKAEKADFILVISETPLDWPNAPAKVLFAHSLGNLITGETIGDTGAIQRYFFHKKRLTAVNTLPVFLNEQWYTAIKW